MPSPALISGPISVNGVITIPRWNWHVSLGKNRKTSSNTKLSYIVLSSSYFCIRMSIPSIVRARLEMERWLDGGGSLSPIEVQPGWWAGGHKLTDWETPPGRAWRSHQPWTRAYLTPIWDEKTAEHEVAKLCTKLASAGGDTVHSNGPRSMTARPVPSYGPFTGRRPYTKLK
jgi:hypothetical protein